MVSAMTIDDVRSAIATEQTTATALVQDFYTRIRQEDPEIGAFLTLCKERALTQAGLIDQMAAEGQPLPPLAGVPVAIKDVMVTARRAHNRRFENSGKFYSALRLHRSGSSGSGGSCDSRQAELR